MEKGSGYVKAFWGAVLVSFGVWGLADSPVSNTLGLEDYHHGALILLTFKEEGNRCMRRQARPGERVYNGVYIYIYIAYIGSLRASDVACERAAVGVFLIVDRPIATEYRTPGECAAAHRWSVAEHLPALGTPRLECPADHHPPMQLAGG